MSRFDERDSANHPRKQEPEFNRLIEAGLSRRGFLKGVGAASMVAFFAASLVARAVASATKPLPGFLTGPVACEITGLAFSPDRRTMFVGVQHPGEEGAPSHFPGGGTAIPRSAVLRITRDDGGIIGT